MSRLYLLCATLVIYSIPFSHEAGPEGVSIWDNRNCKVTSEEGVCMTHIQCKLASGKSVGACGGLGSCCQVSKTCGQESKQRVTFFKNPTTPETDCNLKIKLMNRRICQLRVDFILFSLRQPTNKTTAFTCTDDMLTIIPNPGLPPLCGQNSGQHIYVPVNYTKSGHNMPEFKMHTVKRADNSSDQATWILKITQLECPPVVQYGPNVDTTWNINSIFNPFRINPANGLANRKAEKPKVHLYLRVSDYDKIAPPGCLQYFTEPSGTYESFNLNSNNGPYLANLKYAICFKKTPTVCSIRHTPTMFQLSGNSNNAGATDRDCDTQNGNNSLTEDYLFVIDGITTAGTKASKFCYTSIGQNNSVTSRGSGPLMVQFLSDDKISDDDSNVEIGFKINYTALEDSC